jgi:hypothetical protein
MNILAAIDDRNLLGASIRDAESWRPWRALLAAAFDPPSKWWTPLISSYWSWKGV